MRTDLGPDGVVGDLVRGLEADVEVTGAHVDGGPEATDALRGGFGGQLGRRLLPRRVAGDDDRSIARVSQPLLTLLAIRLSSGTERTFILYPFMGCSCYAGKSVRPTHLNNRKQ